MAIVARSILYPTDPPGPDFLLPPVSKATYEVTILRLNIKQNTLNKSRNIHVTKLTINLCS